VRNRQGCSSWFRTGKHELVITTLCHGDACAGEPERSWSCWNSTSQGRSVWAILFPPAGRTVGVERQRGAAPARGPDLREDAAHPRRSVGAAFFGVVYGFWSSQHARHGSRRSAVTGLERGGDSAGAIAVRGSRRTGNDMFTLGLMKPAGPGRGRTSPSIGVDELRTACGSRAGPAYCHRGRGARLDRSHGRTSTAAHLIRVGEKFVGRVE